VRRKLGCGDESKRFAARARFFAFLFTVCSFGEGWELSRAPSSSHASVGSARTRTFRIGERRRGCRKSSPGCESLRKIFRRTPFFPSARLPLPPRGFLAPTGKAAEKSHPGEPGERPEPRGREKLTVLLM